MTKNKLFVQTAAFTGLLAFTGMIACLAGDSEKTSPAVAVTMAKEDQAALELGRKVLAIHEAIANPQAPDSINAVTALGLETRYYVMVRGWLSYHLAGDKSILDASRERTPKAVKDRIAFLQKAIRAIDLTR